MMMLLLASLAALTPAHAVEPNSVKGDYDLYAKLYPSHVEYCAGTKLGFIGGVQGGYGGHGFTFINGLCKDSSKPYPQVKPCDGSEGYAGVGVSVNSDFQNVNWVAIPGHSLLIDGNLREGERVTQDIVDRVADDANALHVFQNVRIKAELTKDPKTGAPLAFGSPEYLRAVAKNSEGTDLGVRLGRNLECARLPIRKETLQAIADHLNALNNSYYLGGKVYTWSMWTNNCTHVASEILEKAGIRDAIPKEKPMFEEIFNLGIPRNGVFTLIQIGQQRAVLPWDVYRRKADRDSILSGTPYMPTQVGVLAHKYQAFADNSVYEISKLGFWIVPKNLDGFMSARNAFSRPEASQIGPNLLAWEKTDAENAAIVNVGGDPLQYVAWKLESRGTYDSTGFNGFAPAYQSYINAQLAGTREKMKELGLESSTN